MVQDGTAFTTTGLETYFQSKRAGQDAQLTFRLVEFIEATRESLDCAIYDLRHPEVLAALVRVASSGKRLRIAFDASKERTGGLMADPKPSGTEQALETAGLIGHATPVHHGRHLMHNKFLVRDGTDVWTGSANFTTGGLELQDNNCLAIASPDLAARYTAAFEALTGGESQSSPSGGSVTVGAATFTPYFAPSAGEGIEQTVVGALRGARRVRVLAFLISDPNILQALAALGEDPRFDIRGVYDPHGMQDVLRYSQQDPSLFWFMHDPRFVAAPSHAFDAAHEQDFMHNKTLIVDDRLVITGSYNFSENAEANAENLLAIESAEVAAAYTTYFDALHTVYGDAHPVGAGATAGVAPSHTHAMEGSSLAEIEIPVGPHAHVLLRPGRDHTLADKLTHATSHAQFRGENEVGRTEHLVVFSDGSSESDAAARAVLASAEADYAAVQDWFGGIGLPAGQQGDDQTVPRTATPIQVLMDPQAGGAYHFGCNATDLYIEPSPKLASGFMVAELVEVFEAAAGNGWDCGHANGEALSRALAAERNPELVADLLQTEQAWWANGHGDYISNNDATDRDENSNGCGTLFLNYMHSQLGFSWRQIATTGGSSLGACYQKLSGQDPASGFADFVSHLSTLDRGGQLELPASGNPFPIGATAQPQPAPATPPAPSVPEPSAPPPEPAVPEPVVAGGASRHTGWLAVLVLVLLLVLVGLMLVTGRIHLG